MSAATNAAYQPPTCSPSLGTFTGQNYATDHSHNGPRDENEDYHRVQFPEQQGGYQVKMAATLSNQ